MSILKKCKKLGIVFLSVLMIISGMAVFMGNSVNVSAQSNSNVVERSTVYFLDISLYDKVGSTWSIYVENNSDKTIRFYYNTRMCYKDDAAYWTHLYDVESDTLNSGEGRYVTIYENGFATSVAFSWIDGNRRLITYADNLDENSNTFTVYYSGIYA